jgi:hypothetical protein
LKRSWAAWAVGLAVAITLAAGLWLYSTRRNALGDSGMALSASADGSTGAPGAPAAGGSAVSPAPAVVLPMAAQETWTARLFFPSGDDRLLAQEAPVTSGSGARSRAAGAVAALLSVPPVAPRVAVFPPEVKLGKLLLLEDGTVIVDLRSDPVAEPPQSGSTVELLRIYAVVHTVLRNVEEANRVVLLWNGVQRSSLAGHVDTGHPLRLRADLETS